MLARLVVFAWIVSPLLKKKLVKLGLPLTKLSRSAHEIGALRVKFVLPFPLFKVHLICYTSLTKFSLRVILVVEK